MQSFNLSKALGSLSLASVGHLGPKTFVRNATKRAAGSKTNMKDSAGRRLGAKRGDGQLVKVGEIVYRQRGTKIYPGENMGIGKDHTLFALEPGYVRYYFDPFHPKRKFAGVALAKELRLPTPHFAPTQRRFGYEPIIDTEKAERERTVMKRKEYLAQPKLQEELTQREQRREQRRATFETALKELVTGISEAELKIASARLVQVQSFFLGGRTVAESRQLADSDYEQSAQLAKEFGSDEEALERLAEYKECVAKVDAATSLCPEGKLIKAFSEDELTKMAADAIAEAEALVKDVNLMTAETREQVRQIFKKPCFTLAARFRLSQKYATARRPVEQEVAEELVKKGQGKFIETWDHELRKMRRQFQPVANN